MFREKKTWENLQWYRSYTQTFLFCFFIFTNFNTSKLQASENVANSGGLKPVYKWAGVYALVQKK